MRDTSISHLVIAVALTLAGGALAAELDRDDQHFMAAAARSGIVQVQASELALDKAQTSEVRAYAEKAIDQHVQLDNELKALADTVQFTLPTQLTEEDKKLLHKLNQRQGIEFDEEYADEIAVDRRKAGVAAFRAAGERSRNRDIKAFANQHLPTLQSYLKEGEELKDRVEEIKDNQPAKDSRLFKR